MLDTERQRVSASAFDCDRLFVLYEYSTDVDAPEGFAEPEGPAAKVSQLRFGTGLAEREEEGVENESRGSPSSKT